MKTSTIILIGGGGHCFSCIETIRATGLFTIAGILDSKEKTGTHLLDIPFIGVDEDLPSLGSSYDYFLITIGQIKDSATRMKLFDRLQQLELKSPVIISPFAHVSPHAQVEEGTIIMHGALVNAAARIGKNCIINSGAIIEHEVVIGDHSHISTAAVCNGEVKTGKGVFIGSNATIHQTVKIGDGAIVGAGAVVLKNIPAGSTWVGNPAASK